MSKLSQSDMSNLIVSHIGEIIAKNFHRLQSGLRTSKQWEDFFLGGSKLKFFDWF